MKKESIKFSWIGCALIITLILSTVSNSFADGDAVYLPKDNKAPFDGFLITPDKAEKVRNMDIDLQIKTRQLKGEQDVNAILTQRLDFSQKETDSLSKRLIESRDESIFTKAGYFILGAVVTGGLAYGIYKTK